MSSHNFISYFSNFFKALVFPAAFSFSFFFNSGFFSPEFCRSLAGFSLLPGSFCLFLLPSFFSFFCRPSDPSKMPNLTMSPHCLNSPVTSRTFQLKSKFTTRLIKLASCNALPDSLTSIGPSLPTLPITQKAIHPSIPSLENSMDYVHQRCAKVRQD